MKTAPARCYKPNKTITSKAFTLVELLVLMFTGIMFLAFLLPELAQIRARTRCQEVNCLNNLMQIGLSFRTWALDNSGNYPMRVAVTNGGSMEFVNGGKVFPHFLMMSNEQHAEDFGMSSATWGGVHAGHIVRSQSRRTWKCSFHKR